MKTKLGISIALALLAFIFITQNAETVKVTFLAWSTEMSLVLLVFIMPRVWPHYWLVFKQLSPFCK